MKYIDEEVDDVVSNMDLEFVSVEARSNFISLVAKELKEHIEPIDQDKVFSDYIDEIYCVHVIVGQKFLASTILKTDKVAFSESMNDYFDNHDEYTTVESYGEGVFDSYDCTDAIETIVDENRDEDCGYFLPIVEEDEEDEEDEEEDDSDI